MSDPWPRGRLVVAGALGFETALLVLAGGLAYLGGYALWTDLVPTPAHLLLGAGAALPLLGVLAAAPRIPPLRRLVATVDRVVAPLFADVSLAGLAAVAVVAGLAEEALFRGVLHHAIAALAGDGVGLVVTSLLFGLAHPVTPTYVVYAALAGAYLGGLALAFDSLAVPAAAHALYDFGALVMITRPTRRPGPRSDEERDGPDAPRGWSEE